MLIKEIPKRFRPKRALIKFVTLNITNIQQRVNCCHNLLPLNITIYDAENKQKTFHALAVSLTNALYSDLKNKIPIIISKEYLKFT